jgi:PAS domain S-box-containing protein
MTREGKGSHGTRRTSERIKAAQAGRGSEKRAKGVERRPILGRAKTISRDTVTLRTVPPYVDDINGKSLVDEVSKSSQYLLSIIHNANVWLDVLDEEGNVEIWNDAAQAISGYSREEVVGHGKIWEWLYPDEEYRREVFTTAKTIIEQGATEEAFQTRIRCKDDQVRTISWNSRNLLDENRRSIGSIAIGLDVTEQTRIEKALLESEEKYRAIVENSPNMIGIFQNGVLKYINRLATLKLGWNYEELVSPSFDPIENVVSQKSRSLLKENVGKRMRGEDLAPYEMSLTRRDGSEVPVLATGAKIIYNQKPAIEFVFDDITERKRGEENLRQSEERYRSLFDRMLDGVYLSTHEGRFVDVNHALVKMFGYSSKQEMLDITDIKKELYFSPEERGSHLLDTDQEDVKEYRMRRKDGSEIWVEDHGHYVHDEQGNIIYHEGILRDITERKRLEEELKQHSLHLQDLVAARTGELRESEEKYRELFEASPISLWEHDYSAAKQFLDELRLKGVSDFGAYFANHPEEAVECAALVKVLDVNKATLSLYNAKTKDELIGTGGLSRVLVTDNAELEFIDELIALSQGKHYEAEIENTTLSFETKQCHLICAVLPGYEESLGRVLVCIVDLTLQKKLEAENRIARERLAHLIQSNPAVIYSGKPLSDLSNWYATYLSDRVVSMLGYEPHEFMDDSEFWEHHVHPDDLERAMAMVQSLWEEGYYTLDYRFLHKDGEYRWVREETIVLRDADGNPIEVNGYWTDITELKRMELEIAERSRELTESEHKLRSTVDTAVDGIITIDDSGLIQSFNPAAERLFGYTSEELARQNVKILMPEPYRSEHDGSISNYAQTGEAKIIGRSAREVVGRRKDGSTFRMELSVGEIKLTDDHRLFTGIVRDITERKRLENELRFVNAILAAQQEAAIDGILAVDEKGRMISFNQRFVEMWAIPPDVVASKSDERAMQSVLGILNEPEKFVERVRYLYDHQSETSRDEIELVDGRVFDRYSAPILGTDKAYFGRVWYFRDMTRRKEAEEKLRATKEELSLLLNSTAEGIYGLDSQGNCRFTNPSALRLLGYERGEYLIGRNIHDLMHHTRPDGTPYPIQDCKILGAIRSGERVHCDDEVFWRKDGTSFPVEYWSYPQRVGDALVGAVVTFVDVTARRLMEAENRKLTTEATQGLIEVTDQVNSLAKVREKLKIVPDISSGLDIILETALWDFGLDFGAILALDRQANKMKVRASKGKGQEIRLEDSYLVEDFVELKDLPSEGVTRIVEKGERSIFNAAVEYIMPILSGKELFGVMVFGKVTRDAEEVSNMHILSMYADLVYSFVLERSVTITPVLETVTSGNRTIEAGQIYLVKNDPTKAFEVFAGLVFSGYEGLCIARTHPRKIRSKYKLEKTPIIWLTSEAPGDESSVHSIPEMSIMIGDFLDKAEKPVILFEGFEYLILNDGFKYFIKFLQIVKDRVQRKNGILIAPFAEQTMDTRELALLKVETASSPRKLMEPERKTSNGFC